MNESTTISVIIDKETKDEANKLLKDLGLNMSTFINMALRQLIIKQGIPFEVTKIKSDKQRLREFLKDAESIDFSGD